MKILIVDDSALDRKLMSRILQKGDVSQEIIEAEDGEKALQVLAEHYNDICVVLLDWQMPNMSGLEVLTAVARVPLIASVPIIMVTASGSDENKKMARDANPNLAGYLVKPYKAEDLLVAIKPFLK